MPRPTPRHFSSPEQRQPQHTPPVAALVEVRVVLELSDQVVELATVQWPFLRKLDAWRAVDCRVDAGKDGICGTHLMAAWGERVAYFWLSDRDMQELEQLVAAADYAQVLERTGAWSEKQRREAAKWLAQRAKQPLSPLAEAYKQDCGAQWMALLVAQAACVGDVRKAFAIPPPVYLPLLDFWSEYHTPEDIPAAAKAALMQAVARRGRDWAQAWVDAAVGGKRKRPMYADVLFALIDGFGLPIPADSYLVRSWGAALYNLYPRSPLNPDRAPPPYERTVASLSVRARADGGLDVEGRDVRAQSMLEAVHALYGTRTAVEALLSGKDSVLTLGGRYGQARDLDLAAEAVAGLVASGALDRAETTAGIIAALTRGDSVSAQRLQARLLLAADPDPDLLAPHAQTLCSLLASTHGSACEAAQTLLARLDAGRGLEPGLFENACQIVFGRKEKGLRREQLAWGTRRLAQQPAQAAATVQGLMEALSVDDYALQKDAVLTITAAWPEIDAERRAALLALAEASQGVLDGKLYAQLMAALGLHGAPPAAPTAAPVAIDPTPVQTRTGPARTSPEPVAFKPLRGIADDPSDFLAAVGAVAATGDVNAVEQLLDFMVRASNAGQRTLAEKLLEHVPSIGDEMYDMLLQAQGREPRPPERYTPGCYPATASVARMRHHEVARAIRSGQRYALLSTPTYTNGAIEPEDLCASMLLKLRDGARTGPMDLLLALMRTLPATPEQISDLRTLKRPEAGIAADFLEAGGMSQMTTEWLVTEIDRDRYARVGEAEWVNRKQREVCVTLHGMKVLPAIDDIPVEWARGFTPRTAPDVWQFDYLPRYLWAVMPNNAEVLAALHLWGFRKGCRDYGSDGGKATVLALPHFLAASGPAGPALHLAVLFSLSGNAPEAQIAGSDSLITLLGQGRFDEALACELIAATVAHGVVKCGRLAASLARVADAGEDAAVWPLLRSALGAALALGPAPAGTHELMALASRVVPRLGIRQAIAGLPALAASKGSSKLITEGRRLHALLSA